MNDFERKLIELFNASPIPYEEKMYVLAAFTKATNYIYEIERLKKELEIKKEAENN